VTRWQATGSFFDDPEGGWQTADDYLSGNVKRKLQAAIKAALAELRFQTNVEALQLVIPPDIPPGQIEVRLGTHWIPSADVNQFLTQVLDAEAPRRRVVFIIDEAHLLAPRAARGVAAADQCCYMDSQSPFALLLVGQPMFARQLRLGGFAAYVARPIMSCWKRNRA
jgi:hypothetical protein